MPLTLEHLAARAVRDGWASSPGSLEEIRRDAGRLGWSEVALRRQDPPVSTLRPLAPASARPNSLSARYGMGAQPLHTDGAHLREPPDLVLLACEATSSIPTLLWGRRIIDHQRIHAQGMNHGVFLVANGADSFFRTAVSGQVLCYDPGCMTPCDERARGIARFFAEAGESAIEHLWDEPGTVLLIDNRQVLHARAAAEEEPERELSRVAFRLKDGAA